MNIEDMIAYDTFTKECLLDDKTYDINYTKSCSLTIPKNLIETPVLTICPKLIGKIRIQFDCARTSNPPTGQGIKYYWLIYMGDTLYNEIEYSTGASTNLTTIGLEIDINKPYSQYKIRLKSNVSFNLTNVHVRANLQENGQIYLPVVLEG